MLQAAESSPSTRQLYLSSFDVDRLLRDDSTYARVQVLSKVAEHYRVQHFTPHELAIAEQIFRILSRDVEVEVRKALAEELKDVANVPRDIVMQLAEDVAPVSGPILRMSQVLSDADLVYLVETSREVSRIQEVAGRHTVSERVSDAVVQTRYPEAVTSLLENTGAKIAAETLSDVVSDFAHDEAILTTLGQRAHLPLVVAEKLVSVASTRLAEDMRRKYGISAPKIAAAAEKTRDTTILALLEGEVPLEKIEALVAAMLREGRLSTSLVFTGIAQGQLTFFISALSQMANVPYTNALKLATDRGNLGFPALYAKAGLPPSMLHATATVLRHVISLRELDEKPGTAHYADRLVHFLLSDPQSHEIENLPYMLALIRQRMK
jgi:uncharacterized protein (DUF2336 family)